MIDGGGVSFGVGARWNDRDNDGLLEQEANGIDVPKVIAGDMSNVRYPDPTNGHSGIQTAIDDLTTANGGTVWLRPGSYIGSGIKLKQGVSLRGHGRPFSNDARAASILKLADGANTDILTCEGAWLGAVIDGISFDGNQANNTSGGAIVPGDDAQKGLAVYRCTFTQLNGSAIDTSTGGKIEEIISSWTTSTVGSHHFNIDHGDALIARNQIGPDGTVRGIYSTGLTNSKVAQNFIYVGSNGMFLDGTDRCSIVGNRFNTCENTGLVANGTTTHLTIQGNVAYDNAQSASGEGGFRINGTDHSVVGNTAHDKQGVQDYGILDRADYSAYVANTLRNNATAGFEGGSGTGTGRAYSANIT